MKFESLFYDFKMLGSHGVGGVGAVVVGEERGSLGKHVLLRTGIRRRTPIHSAGRLDMTTTQWSHRTSIGIQLECSSAGNRRDGTIVAVGCDCRPVLTALNYLLQHQSVSQKIYLKLDFLKR